MNLKHFHWEPLSEGVYAAIAKNEGGAIANVGVVDLGDYLVILDSFFTPKAALELRIHLEKTVSKPVRYLVNSHFHNDHIRGNQVFSPNTTIIATDECRKLIDSEGREKLVWDNNNAKKQLDVYSEKLAHEKDVKKKREVEFWVNYYEYLIESLPEIKITVPDLTFDNKLILHGKDRILEVINTGKGHTTNDVMMHIPEEKILITGDLVFARCHPYLGSGHLDKWIQTLKRMKGLNSQIVIPGHGPVGTEKDIESMIQYVTDIRKVAAHLKGVNQTDRQEMMKVIPKPYEDWLFGDIFYPMNLQFLLSSLNSKS